MKRAVLIFCLWILASPAWSISGSSLVAGFDEKTVDNHKQLFPMSCIPMSIELVLKLAHRVKQDYFDLQNAWKNKDDGSFDDFDGAKLGGLTFHKQFGNARDDLFPLADLFTEIDNELNGNRYVIISLPSGPGWHMYVIYGKDGSGDYLATSKSFSSKTTLTKRRVKETIKNVKGTDILTYEPEIF